MYCPHCGRCMHCGHPAPVRPYFNPVFAPAPFWVWSTTAPATVGITAGNSFTVTTPNATVTSGGPPIASSFTFQS